MAPVCLPAGCHDGIARSAMIHFFHGDGPDGYCLRMDETKRPGHIGPGLGCNKL